MSNLLARVLTAVVVVPFLIGAIEWRNPIAVDLIVLAAGARVYISLAFAWLSDSGAYFAGRFLGPRWPRKLYETVSPKKTVVGFLGGLVASYGALLIAKLWYLPTLSWVDTAAIAIPANL